jgi:hypothetical protein
MRRLLLRPILVSATLVLLSTSPVEVHQPVTAVTWSDDIAPIIESRCQGCHASSGRSSLPLDSYADARAAARRIKREVLEHRMPPWPAARGFGDYENDRSLSAVEIELLVAWADGGAPRGAGVDSIVARPQTENERSTRAPDLVLQTPSPTTPREGTRTIELATGRSSDAWITAWEFRPGNAAAVEQAELSIVDGEPIGAWVPPDRMTRFPDGVAQRLPAGARVQLRIFYDKTTTPGSDRSSVAFYFGSKPRRILRHRSLPCGSSELPEAIDALAIRPRSRRAGDPIEAVARGPEGRVDVLVWVRDYLLRYEPSYRFRKPVPLARGTSITLSSPEPECAADLAYAVR